MVGNQTADQRADWSSEVKHAAQQPRTGRTRPEQLVHVNWRPIQQQIARRLDEKIDNGKKPDHPVAQNFSNHIPRALDFCAGRILWVYDCFLLAMVLLNRRQADILRTIALKQKEQNPNHKEHASRNKKSITPAELLRGITGQ